MADQQPRATDEIVRGRVAGTWAFRTRAEIEAAARFERMASELAEVGAMEVVVRGCAEAAADERRHRDLCARVAADWGVPDATRHEAPRNRIGRSDMDRRDRLLWELAAVCCISETMNVSLMSRCLEVAKDPAIRATLHELLKDEVRHARLGWAHLAAERAAGRGQFLGEVLPLMLEASIEPGFLEGDPPVPWTDALYEYGELPWEELVRIFRETLNLVVFPGFDAVGIATAAGRAWLEKR
ncbi:MAG: ferritin-like domain-containing protein [Polyangiaceae bacterium]